MQRAATILLPVHAEGYYSREGYISFREGFYSIAGACMQRAPTAPPGNNLIKGGADESRVPLK
jgi:hypothetical protein